MRSRSVRPAISSRHFGTVSVSGCRRLPEPAASTTAIKIQQCKIEVPFPGGFPGGLLTRRVAARLASLIVLLAFDSAQAEAFATPQASAFDRAQARPTASGVVEGSVSTPKPTVRLAGALVVVKDAKGVDAAQTTSDAEGRFTVPGLPAGSYRIIVSLEGFQAADTPIVVNAGRTTALDFELPIGIVAEKVEVVATELARWIRNRLAPAKPSARSRTNSTARAEDSRRRCVCWRASSRRPVVSASRADGRPRPARNLAPAR